jgi:hypothetical protein
MGYFVKNRQLQSGSTGVVVPVGTSATRPDTATFGMIRYNTDIGYCEFYNGTIWQNMGVGGVVTYEIDNFVGDGSSTVFSPMVVAVSDPTQIIVFVGSIYQTPTTNYTVNGTVDITFTSAPPDGMPINIIHTAN